MLYRALAVPLLLALTAPTGTELVWNPADDEALERSFSSTVSGTVQVDVTVDGEEHGNAVPEIRLEANESVRVRDRVEGRAGTGPKRLERTFLEFSSRESVEFGDEDVVIEQASPFTDESVTFVWDADAGEYAIELPEDSGLDADLCTDLVEDMDLRGLLPDAEVEVGDTWSGDVSAYATFVWPSGLLRAHSEEQDARSREELAMDRALVQSFSGEAEVKLVSITDGVAELEVRFEVRADGEVELPIDDESPVTEASRSMEFDREVLGTVEWDLEAGRFRSAELRADANTTIRETSQFSMPGGSAEVVQTRTFLGEIVYRATLD